MSKELSNFVQIRTEFDEEIDKGVLEGALKQAIVRYPYFKVKTAREEEELVLEENTAPLCVYDDADAPTLEPEKNQDYLFRVSAAGKMINISFLHEKNCGINGFGQRPSGCRKSGRRAEGIRRSV